MELVHFWSLEGDQVRLIVGAGREVLIPLQFDSRGCVIVPTHVPFESES